MKKIFYGILDDYFNRTYIYSLQKDLFFKFNNASTHKSRRVHVEVKNRKFNVSNIIYSEYSLLYKIGEDDLFIYIETSNTTHGFINLINYNKNLEYLINIIKNKLEERKNI